MRWAWLVLVVFLVACQPVPDIPYDHSGAVRPDEPEPLRPDIPRTYEPSEVDLPDEELPSGGQPVILEEDAIPKLRLEVPLGERIGELHPIITSREFPLLQHHTIPLTSESYVRYAEELLFDFEENSTGEVRFGIDKDTDEIGSFLFFEEDKVIFEYRVILDGHTWRYIEGRDIQLLGHTYIVAEVTNSTVALFGKDVPSNLLFSDREKLVVRSEKQQQTEVRVRPNLIAYRLYAKGHDASDNILLSPGESLAENVGQDKFASALLNIRYEEGPVFDAAAIRLDRRKFGYDLSFDTPEGSVEIPLVEEDAGELILGRVGERLHVKPCPSGKFCIAPGEMVALTTPSAQTFVLTYSDVSESPARLIMRSPHNRYSYEILGNMSRKPWTDVIVGDATFRTRIGPLDNGTGERNISIEFPRRQEYDLLVAGGFRIRLHDIVNGTLPMEIVVPRELTLDRREEKTSVNITFNGEWTIKVGNVSLAEDEDANLVFGQTRYGLVFLLDREKRSLELDEAEELDVLLPLEQFVGHVRLEG